MATDQFLIAPLDAGLQTDLRPWLIPENAFAKMQNAYVFRGRVRKRFGSRLMNESVPSVDQELYSRFRVKIGSTDGAGNFAGVVPGAIYAVGQKFSLYDPITLNDGAVLTVTTAGAPAALLSTDTTTGTYNTVTGAVTITGGLAGADVYFYSATPVMGLGFDETAAINYETVVGFDRQFAYTYTTALGWQRMGAGAGAALWHGSDSDFFWISNYRGINPQDLYMFVTNYTVNDVMRYWDGATWHLFGPFYNSALDYILTARIIVPFKGRLVLLNVIQSNGITNTVYANRMRYSWVGNPLDATAFVEAPDAYGKGGYLDLPITEAIVSAGFIKDRLIVYCERSTWELVYLGNEQLPFAFQQINSTLGTESTFSAVQFDRVLLGVGNVGVHACNGANVERVDAKIPDYVFELHNENNGVYRVHGIRDYYTEMVYWTVPTSIRNTVFPNQVLVYNYRTQSWALNDDSITCFGYYQPSNDTTWASVSQTWSEEDYQWNASPFDARTLRIIGGNQEGFVFIVDADIARNAPALSITKITGATNNTITAIDHNLDINDIVYINDCSGMVSADNTYKVISVIDKDTFIISPGMTGSYKGRGKITRISRIDIMTKQYNFYAPKNRRSAINSVRFLVDRTVYGAIMVDPMPSSSTISLSNDGEATGAQLGESVLETYPFPLVPTEATQERFWHRVYVDAEGECIQLHIYLTDLMMRDYRLAFSDFQMHAMLFSTQPTGPL